MKGNDFMLNNFHGFTFGYRIPTKVMYETFLDKADDEMYDYLIEHTWEINDTTRIIGVNVLLMINDESTNIMYDISDINNALNKKAKDIDNFIKTVSDTIRIYNDNSPVPLLPQLYYFDVTT